MTDDKIGDCLAAFPEDIENCTDAEGIRLAAVSLYRRAVRPDLPADPMAAALKIVELFARDLGVSRQKALDGADG